MNTPLPFLARALLVVAGSTAQGQPAWQIEFEAGGIPVLRLRIREHRRFTIFDIDPVTAGRWAETMANWSRKQIEAAENPPSGDGAACDEP